MDRRYLCGLSLAVFALLTSIPSATTVGPPWVVRQSALAQPVLAQTEADAGYRAPVLGQPQLVDPFRPPLTRFGAGNRAVELSVGPGEVMVASGSGVVAFAGQLFGTFAISIDHPNGLRSTLTQLATVDVAEGQAVTIGEPVGTATGSGTVSISLRAGWAYLDPAQFWDSAFAPPQRSGRARLVPLPN